ncbi:MAG: hypothetical protein A2Y62_13395 [Candidatus Fischerbacteria bacterium RBG_13_37_8]|uniref:Glucose-6-phosphate isomerase n=1 Tax=Candidatus Fischerbacteria bacterium RBG_13_37_8 TaxID=1817863 RepID=A0A1F5VJM2_9BACT|nr:MAG: hypothetical protein A2Y62_13395 [Candidatus Fischerbacteria bacterium RBG_13_37_8]
MQPISFDYTFAIKQFTQDIDRITHKILQNAIPNVLKAINELRALRELGTIGFTDLHTNEPGIKKVKDTVQRCQNWADTLVIIGIGGSSLGNKCIHMALNEYHGYFKGTGSCSTNRIFILDNLCAEDIASLLPQLDINKTVFNVISKSGTTMESIANFLIFYEIVKAQKKTALNKHFIFTTTSGKGDLYNLAQKSGITCLDIPENVGGRYSVLSPVGLFSSAFAGLNIDALLDGARNASDYCWLPSIETNPAAAAALIYYLYFTKNKKNTHVFWAYSSKLEALCQWFSQLWAESLGKITPSKKTKNHVGQSPLATIGPRDQHSLWQLYVQGPPDKIHTMLKINESPTDFTIPEDVPSFESFTTLKNCSINNIVTNEQQAIEFVLARNSRPFVRFDLPRIDEFHLGQLLLLLEFVTALTGLMLHVDPFDQPGVEEGKQMTYALLNHPRYTHKLAEFHRLYSSCKTYGVVP